MRQAGNPPHCCCLHALMMQGCSGRTSHERCCPARPNRDSKPACAQAKPLRGFDEEVRDFVMEQYGVRGLNLHPGASPTRIVKGPDGKLTVHADVKDGEPLVLEVSLVIRTPK